MGSLIVTESEFKSRQILRLRFDSLDHTSIHVDTTLLDGQDDGQIRLNFAFSRPNVEKVGALPLDALYSYRRNGTRDTRHSGCRP
jgi:hypothetical protein